MLIHLLLLLFILIQKIYTFSLSPVNEFALKISQVYFPHCSLFVTFQKEEFFTLEIMNYFSKHFTTIQFVSNLNPKNLKVSNLKRQTYIEPKRYSKNCLINLNWITHSFKWTEETLETIFQIAENLILRDSHLSIFLFKKLMLMDHVLENKSKLILKIKYKLLFAPIDLKSGDSKNELQLVFKTLCTLCGNGGSHKIINLRQNLIEKNKKILFTDYEKLGFSMKKLLLSYPNTTGFLFETTTIFNSKLGVKKEVAFRGIHYYLLNAVIERLNFTYDIFVSSGGGGTGILLPNKTWLGTVADVIYDKADIGLVVAQILSREMIVSFTYPVTFESLTFVHGPPAKLFKLQTVLWPFHIYLWNALLFSVLALSTILWTLTNFSNYFKRERKDEKKIKLINFIQLLISLLLEQSILMPKRYRSLLITWLFFTILVVTAYKSKLVSFLAFNIYEATPTTYEELVNSEYKYDLQYLGGAAYALLKSSNKPTFVKVFNNMGLQPDAVKCFLSSLKAKYCCICWEGVIDHVSSKNMSDNFGRNPLSIAPVTAFFIGEGWIVKKRVIYKNILDEIVIWAANTGLLNKWTDLDRSFVKEKRFIWEKAVNFSNPFVQLTAMNQERDPSNRKLILKYFYGSLLILFCGTMISLFLFFYELTILQNGERKSLQL